MKHRRSASAFSLLELLAVVVILGIIAAVVVPRMSLHADVARNKVVNHTLAELNQAIEQYFVNEGSYPSSLSDLTTDYLPDGVPPSPVAGKSYSIDSGSHRAVHQ